MPEFSGLCGRRVISRCRLVWENGFKNKVGVYPSDLLPSRRTTWHSTTNASFTFTPPLVGAGDNFGLPILGILGAFNFSPPQFDTFTPQSHFIIMFAQVANRLDSVHIVTQSEIDTMNNDGVAEINVGEFVFEAIAVTDTDKVVTQAARDQQTLTDDDLAEMERTLETKDDKLFRKLFDITVPGNRLKGIKKNTLALEYRLDNGGTKSTSAFNLAGIGDLNSPSYNDGTSKILLVNLKAIANQTGSKDIKAGDKIYLSYIAVKEHYLRQSVEIAWQMQAIANPPQCFGFPNTVKVSNYRFFNWNTKSNDPTTKLSGWRVIETFNMPVNSVCPIGQITSAKIGDLLIGNPGGPTADVEYLPTEISLTELDKYISNAQNRPSYTSTLDGFIGSVGYHTNSGIPSDPNAYRKSGWWGRGKLKYYQSAQEASEHVLFNVHSKALQRRDVDKFGINRFMAQEIEFDIKLGSVSYFPFMDDPSITDPTTPCREYLSPTNTLFKPVLPVSIYSVGNAEIDCGVGGAIQLGYTGNPDNVIAALNFNSNFISERFDTGTKVLVERHFTYGQIGKRFIALQGDQATVNSVSCIMDPSKNYNFIVHVNDDGFLVINKCTVGYLNQGMRNLLIQPSKYDKTLLNDTSPEPDKYEPLIGYNRLLGDSPGFTPGLTVSVSEFASTASFVSKSTDNTTNSDNQISFTKSNNRIEVPLGTGYYGETSIVYSYSGKSFDILILFKNGSDIQSSIDTLFIANTDGGLNTLTIPHSWIKGSTVEIVGENLDAVTVKNITFRQLNPEQANDYLETFQQFGSIIKRDIKNGVFVGTDIVSIAEDAKSRLFVFFNDKSNGISCVQSDNFGHSWYIHYGIVQPIRTNSTVNPFVLTSFENNVCYIFFNLLNKVMCKKISLADFNFADAFVNESFVNDILTTVNGLTAEKNSKLTAGGQNIKYKTLSYLAIGDKTDTEYGELIGKFMSQGVNNPNEVRQIQNANGQFEAKEVRKNPLAIGSNTFITNRDIEDNFFSAYRTDNGVLRLWFLGQNDETGKKLLQCHFSQDDGISWQDALEFTEFGMSRYRFDVDRKTQFIDKTNANPNTSKGNDPLTSNEAFDFGINILGSEEISFDAPYAFYHTGIQKVFLFYIYKSCLLCKYFDDSIFQNARSYAEKNGNKGGLSYLKEILEQQLVSYFIDGDINSILPEVDGYINSDGETVKNGKIIFHHRLSSTANSEQHSTLYSKFDNFRSVSPQRICALELPNGYIRVFYKHTGINNLSAAIFDGNTWMAEDMLKTVIVE